jgi:hypothetical protein
VRRLLSDADDELLVATEGGAVVEDQYWVFDDRLHPHWQDWSWGDVQVWDEMSSMSGERSRET